MTDVSDAGKLAPEYTDTDKAAIMEAEKAGMTSPAKISDTVTAPSVGELHMRVQALENRPVPTNANDILARLTGLEAMVAHVFETYFRTANVPEIIDSWISRVEDGPSEVLDANAKRGY